MNRLIQIAKENLSEKEYFHFYRSLYLVGQMGHITQEEWIKKYLTNKEIKF